MIDGDFDRVAPGHLFPIAEGFVIWERHFTQSQEAEKASEQHCEEEEIVVMSRHVISRDNKLEVVSRQSAFANSGDSFHPHTSLPGATYQGRVSCFLDCRKVGFELLGYPCEIGVDRMWVNVMAHINSVKG